MKNTYAFKKSKIFSRFGAMALDMIIGFLILVFVLIAIVIPIANNTDIYKKTTSDYEQTFISLKIYQKNEDGLGYIKSDYENNLTYFFTNYDSIDNYNKLKAESEVFTYDVSTNTYVPVGTESQMENFYKNALKEANEIAWKMEDVLKVASRYELLNKVMIYIGLVLASVITFLVPALILKDRSSVGMIPFHLQVISKKSGDIATRLQIIFKFLIFLTFELMLTFYYVGYFIMIISAVMVLFTKEKLSLTDFLCSTVVVDKMGYTKDTPERELVYVITYSEEDKVEEVKENE